MDNDPQAGGVFTDADAALLVEFARALFPHPALSDGPYQRAAGYLVGSAEQNPALTREVLAALAEMVTRVDVERMDAADWEGIASGLSEFDFFWSLRAVIAGALYADPETREFIGYPGPSFDLGGYIHRGFDDLSWLPEPRVLESSIAFVEITEGGAR